MLSTHYLLRPTLAFLPSAAMGLNVVNQRLNLTLRI